MVTGVGDELVGRFAAVERAVNVLKSARSGTGRLLAVRGEQGMGKSRLLAEIDEHASTVGFLVLRGRGVSGLRPIPYAALAQALEPIAHDGRDHEVRRIAADVVARLRLTGGTQDAGDASSLRASLHEVDELLRRSAERRPVLLILDDLHATDPDTQSLVAHLAMRLGDRRLVVAAGIRPFPPDLPPSLAEALDLLEHAGAATTIELTPLDVDDVRHLGALLLDGPPDDALTDALWEASRGVPFFVREAALSLQEQGALLRDDDGVVHLYDPRVRPTLGHRNAVIHRIFKLGHEASAVMRALTVVDHVNVDRLDLVAALARLDPEAAGQAIDRLFDARLVVADGSGPRDLVRIVHPIVRNTLYVDLGPAERRRLHDLARRHLEAHGDADDPAVATELAEHVSRSAPVGDAAGVRLLERAAELAAPTAPSSAADWFGAAAELLDDGPERARLAARQARCLFLASRHREAVEAARSALDGLHDEHTVDRIGAILVSSLLALGEFEEGIGVGDDLLARQPGLRRVRVERAAHLMHLDRLTEAEREGTAVLGRATSVAESVRALGQLTYAAFGQGRYDRCTELVDEQLELSERGAPAVRLAALTSAASFLGLVGETDRARAVLLDAGTVAESLGGSAFAPELEAAWAVVRWLRGEWTDSFATLRLATVSLARTGARTALALLRPFEAVTLLESGDLDGARRAIPEASLAVCFASLASWVGAGIDLAAGDAERAHDTLVAAWQRDRDNGRRSADVLLLGALIDASRALERTDEVERWLGELHELPSLDPAPWPTVMRDRLLGAASSDPRRIEAALRLAGASGLVLEQIACHEALADPGHDADTHLADADRLATRIGAELRRRRIAAKLRRRGRVARSRPTEATVSTTQRQLALLVHEGRTNAEIARTLHLSPKTVEAYLTKLYRMFDVAGRLELALAVEAGRLDEP